MSTPPSPAHAPLISARSLALFGAIAVLWTAIGWVVFERQGRERAAASVVQQTEEIRQSVAVISANVDRVLNRLQGVAAVLAAVSDVKTALAGFGPDVAASPLPYESRKSEWTQRPDLLALSRLLRASTEDIGVD